MCNWLACIAMPRLDIDITKRVEECFRLFSSQMLKRWTLTNNSEPILANTDIFLPSNQLTGQTQKG